MKIAPWIVAVLFIGAGSGANAATHYVGPGGNDTLAGNSVDQAWRSISYAANQASPGDTIILLPGRYRERVDVEKPGLRFVASGDGEAVVNMIKTSHPEATDVELVGITFAGSLRIRASGWVFLHCRFPFGTSVSFYRGSAIISNALFVGPSPVGIKVYGASVEAENITVVNYRTALFISSGTLSLRDSIVAGARTVGRVGKNAGLEIEYSGFWQCKQAPIHEGQGNFEADPEWDTEFRLSPISAFVDAGGRPATSSAVSGLSATSDLAADAGVVDLGFHGPSGAPPVPTPTPPSVTPTPVATPTVPAPTPTPDGNPAEPQYFGFGSLTTGGDPSEEFKVRSLRDSGNGSLRAALESARRSGGGVIVFTVAGGIDLRSGLRVPSNTTVDGLSAPPPGITLWGEQVGGGGGVINIYHSNVIVRGLRVRNAGNDGVQIAPKAGHSISDIVVDHCSVTNSDDGGIDVTGGSGGRVTDLTISWNYLAGNGGSCGKGLCGGASLVKYGVSNISFHANFWDKNLRRNPGINGRQIPGGTLADLRYNLLRNPKGSGMQILSTARANVISNYFEGKFTPVWFRGGKVFASDNVAPKQVVGNVNSPFDVIGEPPFASWNDVLDNAGVQPRDDADSFYISQAETYSDVRANPFSP